MGEKEGVSRRDFLKIAGTGIVGLAIGLGAGYGLGKRAAAPTTTETATGFPGVPSKPLKVGFMYFMTGALGTYGQMASAGLELARDEINAAGGILGRKVEFTSKDEADREHVIDNLVKMVEDEGAEVLIGLDSSGDALKVIKTIEQDLQVPLIVTHAATPKLTECNDLKYIFRVSMYEEPIDIAAAHLAAENYPDTVRVASIGPDYAYGWDSWTVFSTKLKELLPNVEFVDPIYVPLGTPDYTSYIDSLISAEPDILFSSLWGGDAANFFKQAKAKGLLGRLKAYINPMLGATDTLKAIGDENVPSGVDVWGSGRYWFLYPPHDVYPFNKQFVDKFRAKTGEYPAYVAGTSYTALYALKAAVERAYEELGRWPDPGELAKALEGLAVAGPMGPVYIRPDDHQGMYEVYWGKLVKGGPEGYPHPILKDLRVFSPSRVFPPPKTTYVKCG